jgi:hypothetical protein
MLLVSGLCFLACGGSKRPPADEFWSTEQHEEEARPLRETEELGVAPHEAETRPETPLLGVRHDVTIAESAPHAERCSCLAVAVGAPNDPRFAWQAGAPSVGPDAVAIAISGKGVACPAAGDAQNRRPSISAVDRDGADVLVEVEELPPGRPLASGAIIPRPGPGGAIYVRPKNKSLPYAQPGRCKVQ